MQRWTATRDAMQAALEDPELAVVGFEGFFGPTTLNETVDGFMSPDLLVHTWDIARTAGLEQYEAMPDDEVERVHARLASLGDAIRQTGAFGPEVPVPAGASPQDRFLGFIGRRP